MARSVALEHRAAFMLHCGITWPGLDSQGGSGCRPPSRRRQRRSLALLLGLGLGLSACSSDDFDPAGWISGPAEPPKQISAAQAESDPGFPRLGGVPPRLRPSPQVERQQRALRLQADLATAQYATGAKSLPAKGETVTAQAAPSAPSVPPRATLAIPRTPTPPGPAPLPPRPLPDQIQAAASPPLAPLAPPGAAPPSPGTARSGDDAGAAALGGELVALLYFPALGRDVASADRTLLRDLALLQQQRRGRLRIVGHAAEEAPVLQPEVRLLADLELSQARAAAVAAALAKLGVPSDRITVAGAGHGQPRFDPASAAGAAGNRRVEVFLE